MFFQVLFRQILFSRTFQDSPVCSSTFQACANPDACQNATLLEITCPGSNINLLIIIFGLFVEVYVLFLVHRTATSQLILQWVIIFETVELWLVNRVVSLSTAAGLSVRYEFSLILGLPQNMNKMVTEQYNL